MSRTRQAQPVPVRQAFERSFEIEESKQVNTRIRNWHGNELEDLAHDCRTLGHEAPRTNGDTREPEAASRN
jgi:hypothetical protein